jgi:hypothetical protein
MTLVRSCANLAMVALLIGSLMSISFSQTRSQRSEGLLRTFLQEHLRDAPFPDDKTTEYSAAYVDLNGDGKEEIIVHIIGRSWCGTGGCHTLIIEPTNASFDVISEISITRPPIRVLKRSSHGWKNLTVWVEGGGILPGYEAELRFDGKTYPENPTVSPAKPLSGKVSGKIVVSESTQTKRLYAP